MEGRKYGLKIFAEHNRWKKNGFGRGALGCNLQRRNKLFENQIL